MLFSLELVHPFEKIPKEDHGEDCRKQKDKELDDQKEDEDEEEQSDEKLQLKSKCAFSDLHGISKVPEV